MGDIMSGYDELLDEFHELKDDIGHSHEVLSSYGVGKEHWSVAGRIDALVLLIIKQLRNDSIDEVVKKLNKAYYERNR